MGDSGTKQRIVKRFDSEGIDSTRLRLLGRTPGLLSHLRLYNDVHIALDTFPYNGTTTTCEALWMGTPVVTLSGEVDASRVGEALLRVVGREGWVARDADDYVARVLGLAADRAALSAASAGLRAALDGGPRVPAWTHGGRHRDPGPRRVGRLVRQQLTPSGKVVAVARSDPGKPSRYRTWFVSSTGRH